MLAWVCKGVLMPTSFGIICAVNALICLNERKSGFVTVQIVEDVDKGFRRSKMNSDMENVNIYNAFLNVLHPFCVATSVPYLKKEVGGR